MKEGLNANAQGRYAEALQLLESSVSGFQRAGGEAKENRAQISSVESAKKKAVEAEAAKYATMIYDEAVKNEQQGMSAISKGDFANTVKFLTTAAELYGNARKTAVEFSAAAKKTKTAHESALAYFADTISADQFSKAAAELKQAETANREGRYGEALQLLEEAEKNFALAEKDAIRVTTEKIVDSMMKVEAGSFKRGEQQVTLTKDFYIGKYEVTQAQWMAVMGNNPAKYKGCNRPVECVRWNDAMEFCKKLNESGKAPAGYKFSLPTDAQWEFAARGGNKSNGYTYSGSNEINEIAWYNENSGEKTHAVGTKKPNELGIYDMSGNVWEWCLDWWYGDHGEDAVTDPQGPMSGSKRMQRGGCWYNVADNSRTAYRSCENPDNRYNNVGFRLALVPIVTAEEEAARKAEEARAVEAYVNDNLQTFDLNGVELKMIRVKAGKFQMGSENGHDHEKPVHAVTLTKDYYLGQYEVTQAQYQAVMGNNPTYRKGDNLPVAGVTWYDAMEFCKKLNDLGLAPAGYKFSLPTEAQWEFAARGGNRSKVFLYSGSNEINEVAWYNENSGDESHEIGTKKPNELGIYDMSGNVWEWCLDWYGGYGENAVPDPQGPESGEKRVQRGGCHHHNAYNSRTASRSCENPDDRYSNIGFRLALVPVTAEEVRRAEDARKAEQLTVDLNNGVELKMIRVKAGTFPMGSNNGEYDEKPVHQVTLTKDYYLGQYEVTQAQYQAVMGNNPSVYKGDNRPVEKVSWNDAMEFCRKLNVSGKAPAGWKFTLPTEAQWEYAARGGNKSKGYTYSGSNEIGDVAWYNNNSYSETHRNVGTQKPNELGLYDMSGNVWEWCLDWYGGNYYSNGAVTDPQGPGNGSHRVFRGGSWSSSARDCRSASRGSHSPDSRGSNVGFRLALVPVEEARKAEQLTVDLNGVELKMIRVKAGTFQMGSENGDSDEKPVHQVTLTKDYYLGQYEVTQAQYQAVMGNNPSDYKGDNRPVEKVSWNDAMEFCKKLNDSGKAPEGWKFTLPTEAQWEFAARGGNKSKGYTYSGSNEINDVAWYDDNAGWDSKHRNVGTKKPNELGLYDMSGNVWEWCLDWYGGNYYSNGAVTDPQGPGNGSHRVFRGGSWVSNAYYCRTAARSFSNPGYRNYYNGFRVALVPVQ